MISVFMLYWADVLRMLLYRAGGNAQGVIFFLNDPATTEIYTLSLHDALPI